MTEMSILAKATLVLLIGLAATALARRARASIRHAMLTAAFAAVLALPLATMMLPTVAIALPEAPARIVERVAPPASSPQPVGLAPAMPNAAPSTSAVSMSLDQIAVNVWRLGAALLLMALIAGVANLRRLCQHGLPWLEAQHVVATLAERAGIRQRIELLLHERVSAPLTCGLVRPSIVVPMEAREWSDAALRRALVHELEHVRRRDWWVHLAARAVCALYWFHPLVWIAYRQLQLEAERACDDAVVEREEVTQYAEQLVSLARKMSASAPQPALTMASRGDLSARITALLDARQSRGRVGLGRVALIGAVTAVVLLTLAPTRIVAATADTSAVSGNAGQRRSRSSRMDRILVEAADEGDIDDVRQMLDDGADVNAAVDGDGSPLIAAAREGHADLVTLLLDRGADPNLAVPGDGNALIMAAQAGHTTIVATLLDRGARIEDVVPGDENALIQASGAGALDVVKLLVARGANVNARVFADAAYERPRGEWRTPLNMAQRGGHAAVVAFLIASGATQ